MTPAAQTQPKIRIRGLHKAFGQNVVLDGIDLEIFKGESLVVIGGSGTGKSVLLKCILGLLKPDSGSIEIDGENIVTMNRGKLDKVRAKVGMLFQGAALFDSLPVWENVAFGLIQGQGMNRNKARAIATKPEILFFDEPTTGLDPIMGAVIDKLISKCIWGLGATGITITHDMASARRISDRMAMLYKGRIIWDGKSSEMERSGNAYVDQFIKGDSEGPIDLPLQDHF